MRPSQSTYSRDIFTKVWLHFLHQGQLLLWPFPNALSQSSCVCNIYNIYISSSSVFCDNINLWGINVVFLFAVPDMQKRILQTSKVAVSQMSHCAIYIWRFPQFSTVSHLPPLSRACKMLLKSSLLTDNSYPWPLACVTSSIDISWSHVNQERRWRNLRTEEHLNELVGLTIPSIPGLL